MIDPTGDRNGLAWPLRAVSATRITAVGIGAALLLWGLAGWSGIAAGVALGAAIALRLLGVLLLPRRLRERSAVLVLPVVILVLLVQSSWWAITLTGGLVVDALALTQRGRTRVAAALVGLAVAVAGGVGAVAAGIVAAADQKAASAALDDVARGRILPHRPDQVPMDLMRRIARAVTEGRASCSIFDERGQREFLAAFGSGDCLSALRAAGAQIRNPEDYDRIDGASLVVQPRPDGAVVVDGCAVRWRDESLSWVLSRPLGPRPGPPPGRLVVAPAFTVAWRITSFQRC